MASLDKPSLGVARPAFLPGREVMSIMDAIYSHRAVRDFTADEVPEASLHALLYAAVQPPSVVAGEVPGFAVVQDRPTLAALSDCAGRLHNGSQGGGMAAPSLADRYVNIFFNAGTLVVIYGRSRRAFAQADGWLAAENLMLAAGGMGLGTCVVELAVDALNTAEWRARLEIPPDMIAVAPIILGIPAHGSDPVHRSPPDILSWMRG